jgi:hypothetical protein
MYVEQDDAWDKKSNKGDVGRIKRLSVKILVVETIVRIIKARIKR